MTKEQEFKGKKFVYKIQMSPGFIDDVKSLKKAAKNAKEKGYWNVIEENTSKWCLFRDTSS